MIKLTFVGNPHMIPISLFQYYDTHGVPFAVSLARVMDSGFCPDWERMAQQAKAAGWSKRKLSTALTEAILDVYPPNTCPVVIERLHALIDHTYGSN